MHGRYARQAPAPRPRLSSGRGRRDSTTGGDDTRPEDGPVARKHFSPGPGERGQGRGRLQPGGRGRPGPGRGRPVPGLHAPPATGATKPTRSPRSGHRGDLGGDGATGWALMIGLETVGFGRLAIAPERRPRTSSPRRPEPVFCGALNPRAVARAVRGGWMVSGQWPFASGCHARRLLLGPVHVDLVDPTKFLEVIVPRADYQILATWQVNGLRGSGSHDVAVRDLFVPETDDPHPGSPPGPAPGHAVRVAAVLPPRLQQGRRVASGSPGPRSTPSPTLCSASPPAHEPPAAGAAPGPAGHRPGRGDRAQRPGVLLDVSAAHGRPSPPAVAAARPQAGDRPPRLLAGLPGGDPGRVHAVRRRRDQPEPRGSVLGRCLRDVVVVPQQIMVAPHFIEDAGRVLLGLDPPRTRLLIGRPPRPALDRRLLPLAQIRATQRADSGAGATL